jgi:hypothetical protein
MPIWLVNDKWQAPSLPRRAGDYDALVTELDPDVV